MSLHYNVINEWNFIVNTIWNAVLYRSSAPLSVTCCHQAELQVKQMTKYVGDERTFATPYLSNGRTDFTGRRAFCTSSRSGK